MLNVSYYCCNHQRGCFVFFVWLLLLLLLLLLLMECIRNIPISISIPISIWISIWIFIWILIWNCIYIATWIAIWFWFWVRLLFWFQFWFGLISYWTQVLLLLLSSIKEGVPFCFIVFVVAITKLFYLYFNATRLFHGNNYWRETINNNIHLNIYNNARRNRIVFVYSILRDWWYWYSNRKGISTWWRCIKLIMD